MDEKLLNKAFEGIRKKKYIYSAVFRVEKGDGSFSWENSFGECEHKSRYFIASTTKLYITNIMLQLQIKGLVDFDDLVIKYIDGKIIKGLVVYKGKDYTNTLTIKHLISNSSGIPDYFFHKQNNGKTIADDLLEGNDSAWTFTRTIENVKTLNPKFYPGQKRKAAYSDTNYTLLGAIIEKITGLAFNDALEEYILKPLKLKNTYGYNDIRDDSVVPFYYKDRLLWLPKYMTSITPEGGLVSTAEESNKHLQAFFKGDFFDKDIIDSLKDWRLILPPPSLFHYGIGLEKLIIPSFMTGFKSIGEVLGFWGQTGSFSFYHKDTDLYFTGTTNQINGSGHAAAMRAMIKIIKSELK